MHQGIYIKQLLKQRRITQEGLASELKISRGHIIKKLNEVVITDDKLNTKQKILDFLNIQESDLPKPTQEEIKEYILREADIPYQIADIKKEYNALEIGEIETPDDESPFIDLHNGQYVMLVPLVEEKARAGYIEHIADKEYVGELPKHSFIVDRQHRGKYFAFRVVGDSMDNGTVESIPEGSIVTGRDISQHLWRSKFHINRFKDYVIVHKDGIIIKRITEHDVDNGIITCHSLNTELFPDFQIHLDDCRQILNVVNVTHIR